MILGTFIFTVFRSFIAVMALVARNPWYLLKVAFVWFFVVMAVTYGYFLWTHQDYIAKVRKELALCLGKSLWFGFLCTAVLVGLYEFILQMLCASTLFMASADTICYLSLTQGDPMRLFRIMSTIWILLNAFWAYHFVEPLLVEWHEKRVVEGYGWLIIAVSLLCFGFLWCII